MTPDLTKLLAAWLPDAPHVDRRERLRAAVGAALGLLLTALLSRWAGGGLGLSPWLIAPMGASAVLVFAVPASPLAQPWSVLGGNGLSALVGLACAWALPDPAWAGALAVGLAILAMMALRCLHPPGGATALLAVLMHAGPQPLPLGVVMLNSLLLVLAGVAYNSATGRRYPHVAAPVPADAPALPGPRFTPQDLDAALAHYNQVLDVSRDDLEELLHQAEAAAFRRNLGDLRCADIMTPAPLTVTRTTPVAEARAHMRERGVKALPVVDAQGRLIGIVTLTDVVDAAAGAGAGADRRLVNDVMTRRVRVASADSRVIGLLQLFSEGGHHHLPIVDEATRVVGIVTQSDLVRALHRAVRAD